MTKKQKLRIERIKQQRITNTKYALAKKEVHEHLGRWCEITLKRTGEVIRVIRTGYGPMEYPERDKHVIEIDGVAYDREFKDLGEVAKFLCER